MKQQYLLQSFLIHAGLFAALFLSTLFRSSPEIIWLEGFDYMGGGGGGGGGNSGPKASQMGQVVPQPVKQPLPEKPAPIQKATKGEETWKVKDAKDKEKPKEVAPPSETVERGEKTQEEKSNVIRKGVAPGTTAGEGSYDFGAEGEGTGGAGIGIGFGPGSGGGGFGFGSYLRVMRQRIWSEWTQSAVYGSKLSCVVGMTVSMNGDVSELKLEKSSGNSFYDNVALRAVRNASPLPPLPPNFPKSSQRFNINFKLQD